MVAYLLVPFVRNGALVLVAALVALVFVQVEWRDPLMRDHAAAEARFQALRQEVGELTARIDSVETFDAMERQLAEVANRFEAGIDRSGVVERLTALSSSAGTRIIHGANTFGRARGDVVPVEQDLTVEGTYAALAAFLSGLDRLETLTLLRSVEMAANPDETLVRAKVKLMTLSRDAGG